MEGARVHWGRGDGAMRATDDLAIVERLAHRAVELAEALLREARAQQTADEHAQAKKLARMMADPHGKELTIALADQAFRSHRPERIADQLAYLLERYGVPQYMDWWERVGLLLGGAMAHYLPSLVVPPIVARLRHETQNVILPGEEDDLKRYLEERRRDGMRLNLNQLGEAILGEAEAARRLEAYCALLARDDVEYISVKVSSVFSQIDLVAFRPTVAHVAERLRTLYRVAARHRYIHPHGRVTPKVIHPDMEEYRDLDLTVTAFREVLDEPEFLPLSAGVVLQAYLPVFFQAEDGIRDLIVTGVQTCALPISGGEKPPVRPGRPEGAGLHRRSEGTRRQARRSRQAPDDHHPARRRDRPHGVPVPGPARERCGLRGEHPARTLVSDHPRGGQGFGQGIVRFARQAAHRGRAGPGQDARDQNRRPGIRAEPRRCRLAAGRRSQGQIGRGPHQHARGAGGATPGGEDCDGKSDRSETVRPSVSHCGADRRGRTGQTVGPDCLREARTGPGVCDRVSHGRCLSSPPGHSPVDSQEG